MAIRINTTKTVIYTNPEDAGDFITQDITYKDAYVKVVSVGGSKDIGTILVRAYENKESENTIWVKTYSFIPSVREGSVNFIAQAYIYLKTLPEFTSGEDC